MTKEIVRTSGGTHVDHGVQSGRDFVGRDVINIAVQETYLHQVWHHLDADLQDALTLAYNQVLREGGEQITLTHLLSALLRLHPELAEEFTPLLRLTQDIRVGKRVRQIGWQDRKLMEVNSELQLIISRLLARHTNGHPLSYMELITALVNGPERPFPRLLGCTIGKLPLFEAFMAGHSIGSTNGLAGTGGTIKKIVCWKPMSIKEAPEQWN